MLKTYKANEILTFITNNKRALKEVNKLIDRVRLKLNISSARYGGVSQLTQLSPQRDLRTERQSVIYTLKAQRDSVKEIVKRLKIILLSVRADILTLKSIEI